MIVRRAVNLVEVCALYSPRRVKIIDNKIEEGKLYLKKGTVVDVKTPEVCDIYIDELSQVFMVSRGIIVLV